MSDLNSLMQDYVKMAKKQEKIEPVVLQVLPELETGGVELGTLQVATEMKKAGIKNFVASQGGRMVYDLEKQRIPHLTLPLKSKNIFTMLKNAKKLEAFIKENGINIVHARSRAPAWSAYWAAKRAGIHFITTFHGTYGLGPWGIKKFYNRVMTYGEKVIVISNHIKQHVLKNYKTDENKLVLIHRCVDLEKFSPDKVSQERMINKIKEYNIPEDRPVLLLVGRITRWKGQHLLIEALSKLKTQDYYCIIAGDEQGRIKYLNSLKALVDKYNLNDRVCFHGKVLDVPALMMVSNIVLSTAIDPEAFGRISIEGQSLGKIVVASNIGGSLDTIEDEKNGKLFMANDAQSLADALDWALSISDAQKEKISKAGIKNAREHFTKQIMCDKTIEIYRSLLSN